MVSTTLSSRGQIVIPVDVRRAAGWSAGDKILVTTSEDGQEVRLRKQESLDKTAARLSQYLTPGTPPLIDVHGFYDTRSPRV
ncbi:MAG: AbrB/MazE/SpoVT family DNA-binding domain-containing protein [Micrococcales bacterium]|nr:AbrB/MazE/SpoVT family DNA-binding domain-containing protein [Micrococcales bacterium]